MKKTEQRSIHFPKYLILMFLLVPLSIACTRQPDEAASGKEVQDADPVEGVWELTNHYWVLMDDTIYADELGVSHKIYLDGYVMWTVEPGADSSEWHGFGTYRISNDTLIERLSSMSLPMRLGMGTEDEVTIKTEYGKNFIKQEMDQVFRDTIYRLVEEWKKLN
jgi:hypothetical protein